MRIWIFQSGEPLHTDDDNFRPMRAVNLANVLLERGHDVEIWSSTFFHQEKRHRAIETQILKPRERLEIRLIHSPGYRKNIGIGRLYDHGVFAYNLLRTLNKQNFISPDVVFIGYPPIETSAVMAHWLKK